MQNASLNEIHTTYGPAHIPKGHMNIEQHNNLNNKETKTVFKLGKSKLEETPTSNIQTQNCMIEQN